MPSVLISGRCVPPSFSEFEGVLTLTGAHTGLIPPRGAEPCVRLAAAAREGG